MFHFDRQRLTVLRVSRREVNDLAVTLDLRFPSHFSTVGECWLAGFSFSRKRGLVLIKEITNQPTVSLPS